MKPIAIKIRAHAGCNYDVGVISSTTNNFYLTYTLLQNLPKSIALGVFYAASLNDGLHSSLKNKL